MVEVLKFSIFESLNYNAHIFPPWFLFFYTSSSRDGESKLHVYEEVCKNTESGDLAKCLVKDFQVSIIIYVQF